MANKISLICVLFSLALVYSVKPSFRIDGKGPRRGRERSCCCTTFFAHPSMIDIQSKNVCLLLNMII